MGGRDGPRSSSGGAIVATRYDSDRAQWSQRAHLTARRVLYPALFACEEADMEFRECDAAPAGTPERLMDTALGIDKVVLVRDPLFRLPIRSTVQERFQTPTNARRRNITITEFNEATGQPSELYKMVAQWFVGAFMTDDALTMTEGVAVSVADLRRAMRARHLAFDLEKRNDKGQPFVRIEFDDLIKLGIAQVYVKNNEVEYDRFADPFDELDPVYPVSDNAVLFRWLDRLWRYDPPPGTPAFSRGSR